MLQLKKKVCPCLIELVKLKHTKARVWSPSVSIPAPHSYSPRDEERHLLDLSSPLPKL